MTQLKFDKDGVFIPQKINYKPKRDEETEEMLEKYIKKRTDFQIDYDRKGNAIFIEKEEKVVNNE